MTAPAPERADSAIHDLGYRRYGGANVGASGAWRALFRQGCAAMFGIGQPARAKAMPVIVLVVTMLPALATLSASAMSQGMVPVRHGPLLPQQILLVALFAAAQVPEVLSRDQQHGILPLILTRSVTRASYASARFAAIVVALFGVTLAPLLLMYLGEIGAASDPTAAFERLGGRPGAIVAQAALAALALGGIAAALAAWTPRRAFATAAIIGSFLAAAAVGAALDDLTGISRRTAELFNPLVSLGVQGMLLFEESNRGMERVSPLPLAAYAGAMAAYAATGAALLYARIRALRT